VIIGLGGFDIRLDGSTFAVGGFDIGVG